MGYKVEAWQTDIANRLGRIEEKLDSSMNAFADMRERVKALEQTRENHDKFEEALAAKRNYGAVIWKVILTAGVLFLGLIQAMQNWRH